MKRISFALLFFLMFASVSLNAFNISGKIYYSGTQVFDTAIVVAWPDTYSVLRTEPMALGFATKATPTDTFYSYIITIDTAGIYYLFVSGDVNNNMDMDIYEPKLPDTGYMVADISSTDAYDVDTEILDYPSTNSGVAIELAYYGLDTGNYRIEIFKLEAPDTEPNKFMGGYDVPGPDTYYLPLLPGDYAFSAYIDTDYDGIGSDTEPFGGIGFGGTDDTPIAIVDGSTPVITLEIFDPPFSISGSFFYTGTISGEYIIEAWRDSSFLSSPVDVFLVGYDATTYNIKLSEGEYWLRAFIDANGNGVLDSDEPMGLYGADGYIYVSADTTGVDITITDPPVGYVDLTLNYTGTATGNYMVQVTRASDFVIVDSFSVTGPGVYLIELEPDTEYIIEAGIDVNADSVIDAATEPYGEIGVYGPPDDTPVFVVANDTVYVTLDIKDPSYLVSGNFYYSGTKSGYYYIQVWDTSDLTLPPLYEILVGYDTTSYTIDLPGGEYWIGAYIDTNGDSLPDGEPTGLYGVDGYLFVDGDTTGIDITINDPAEGYLQVDLNYAGTTGGDYWITIERASDYLMIVNDTVPGVGTYVFALEPDTEYIIKSGIDADLNGYIDPSSEPYGAIGVEGPPYDTPVFIVANDTAIVWLDILDPSASAALITGTLSYYGNDYFDTVTVVVWSDTVVWDTYTYSFAIAWNSGNIDNGYGIDPDTGIYYVGAFGDINGNGIWDLGEPRGVFGGEEYPASVDVRYGPVELIDFELITLKVFGVVNYYGSDTGTLRVIVVSEADDTIVADVAADTYNEYSVVLSKAGDYGVYAYLDKNDNGIEDYAEQKSYYNVIHVAGEFQYDIDVPEQYYGEDNDGDGIDDEYEIMVWGDTITAGEGTDYDADGVTDFEEFIFNTPPDSADIYPQTANLYVHFANQTGISGDMMLGLFLPSENDGPREVYWLMSAIEDTVLKVVVQETYVLFGYIDENLDGTFQNTEHIASFGIFCVGPGDNYFDATFKPHNLTASIEGEIVYSGDQEGPIILWAIDNSRFVVYSTQLDAPGTFALGVDSGTFEFHVFMDVNGNGDFDWDLDEPEGKLELTGSETYAAVLGSDQYDTWYGIHINDSEVISNITIVLREPGWPKIVGNVNYTGVQPGVTRVALADTNNPNFVQNFWPVDVDPAGHFEIRGIDEYWFDSPLYLVTFRDVNMNWWPDEYEGEPWVSRDTAIYITSNDTVIEIIDVIVLGDGSNAFSEFDGWFDYRGASYDPYGYNIMLKIASQDGAINKTDTYSMSQNYFYCRFPSDTFYLTAFLDINGDGKQGPIEPASDTVILMLEPWQNQYGISVVLFDRGNFSIAGNVSLETGLSFDGGQIIVGIYNSTQNPEYDPPLLIESLSGEGAYELQNLPPDTYLVFAYYDENFDYKPSIREAYADTALVMQDTSVTGINLVLSIPEFFGNIIGKIYNISQVDPTLLVVSPDGYEPYNVEDAIRQGLFVEFDPAIDTYLQSETTVDYALMGIPKDKIYYVIAFIDVNRNYLLDPDEPKGIYSDEYGAILNISFADPYTDIPETGTADVNLTVPPTEALDTYTLAGNITLTDTSTEAGLTGTYDVELFFAMDDPFTAAPVAKLSKTFTTSENVAPYQFVGVPAGNYRLIIIDANGNIFVDEPVDLFQDIVDFNISFPQQFGGATAIIEAGSGVLKGSFDTTTLIETGTSYVVLGLSPDPYGFEQGASSGLFAEVDELTGDFAIDKVPEGYFFLYAFTDLNQNGVPDYDEPQFVYGDEYGPISIYIPLADTQWITQKLIMPQYIESGDKKLVVEVDIVADTEELTDKYYNVNIYRGADVENGIVYRSLKKYIGSEAKAYYIFDAMPGDFYHIRVVDDTGVIYVESTADIWDTDVYVYVSFPTYNIAGGELAGNGVLKGSIVPSVDTAPTFVVLGYSPDEPGFDAGAQMGLMAKIAAGDTEFTIEGVPSGVLFLAAFTDLNGNYEPDIGEPLIVLGDEYGPIGISITDYETTVLSKAIEMPLPFEAGGLHRVIVEASIIADTEMLSDTYYTVQIFREGDQSGLPFATLKKYISSSDTPPNVQKYVFLDVPSDYYRIMLFNEDNSVVFGDQVVIVTDTDAFVKFEFPFVPEDFDYEIATGIALGAGNSTIKGQLLNVDTPSQAWVVLGYEPSPEGFEKGAMAGLMLNVDAAGNFAFENIPAGGYFLFAWQDENGDNEPQPKEKQGIFGNEFGPQPIYLEEGETVDVDGLELKLPYVTEGPEYYVEATVKVIADTENLLDREYRVQVYYIGQDPYVDYPALESDTFTIDPTTLSGTTGGPLPQGRYIFAVRDKEGILFNLVDTDVVDSPTKITIEIPKMEKPGIVAGALKGKIVDVNGVGIDGVNIFIEAPQAKFMVTTLADGTFFIDNIPSDTYQVVIAKPGYVSFSTTIFVPAGEYNLGTKMLKKEATIKGIVRTNDYAEVFVVLTDESVDLNVNDTFNPETINIVAALNLMTDSGVPVEYFIGGLKSGIYKIYVAQSYNETYGIIIAKYSNAISLVSGEQKTDINFPYVYVYSAKDISQEKLTISGMYVTPIPIYEGDTSAKVVFSLNVKADTLQIQFYLEANKVYETTLQGGLGVNEINIPSEVVDTAGAYTVNIMAERVVDSTVEKVFVSVPIKVKELNIITYARVGSGRDDKGNVIQPKEKCDLYIFFGMTQQKAVQLKIYDLADTSNPVWSDTTIGYVGDNIYKIDSSVVAATFKSGIKYFGEIYVIDEPTYRKEGYFGFESAELKLSRAYVLAPELEKGDTDIDVLKIGLKLENVDSASVLLEIYEQMNYILATLTDNLSQLVAIDEFETDIFEGDNVIYWDANKRGAFDQLKVGKTYIGILTVKVNSYERKSAVVFKVIEAGTAEAAKLLNLFVREKEVAITDTTTVEVRATFSKPVAEVPTLTVYHNGEQKEVTVSEEKGELVIYKVSIGLPEGKEVYTFILTYGDASKVAVLKVINKNQEKIADAFAIPMVFAPGGDLNLTILYTLTDNYQGEDVICTFVNDANEVVKVISGVTGTPGIINRNIVWDGKGDTGFVPEGNYRFVLSVGTQRKYGVFKVVAQDVEPPQFIVVTGKKPGEDVIQIGVIASEPLMGAPTVLVGVDQVTVTQVGNSNFYRGEYSPIGGIADNEEYVVTVTGYDLYENLGSGTGRFIKRKIEFDTPIAATDGVQINIPSNAVSDTTALETLVVTKGEPIDVIGQEDHKFGENTYDFSVNDTGIDFNSPVEIRIPITDDDLASMEITDENKVYIYYYDEELGRWKFVGGEIVEDTSVSPTQKYVVAYVSHFTTFAIGSDVVAPDEPTISDSDPLHGKVSGVAEPGAVIQVLDENGNVISTTAADEESGEFSISVAQSLAGASLIAIDESGNASLPVALAASAQTATVDAQAKAFAYPNPFGPGSEYGQLQTHTTIRYDATLGKATVRIYNIAGELVWNAQDNDESGKDGNSELGYIQWKGQNNDGQIVSSGVYYAIVEYGSNKDVIKIGFIR